MKRRWEEGDVLKKVVQELAVVSISSVTAGHSCSLMLK